jgi:hypothetical protein
MRHDIRRTTLNEYGVEPTVRGALDFEDASCPPSYWTARKRRFARRFAPGSVPPVLDAYDGRVDPMAFVHASRILARQHGWRDVFANPKQHGGWDSEGHWGLSGEDVRRAWYAAGCRPSRKFEALIRLGGAADQASQLRLRRCKGLSLRQISDAARALRRTSAEHLAPVLSTKLLCALGRLCPELQRVALQSLPPVGPRSTYRIRDVNWERVAQVQEQFRLDHVLRVAWATGRRQEDLAGVAAVDLPEWLGCRGRSVRDASEAVRRDETRAFTMLVLQAQAS